VALGGQGIQLSEAGGLEVEVLLGRRPIGDFSQKLVDRFAAMVASDRFVKVPPDPLDRIRLGGVFGKEVQHDSICVSSQVITDGSAIVELGVVADHVDHSIRPQLPTKVVEVGQEERSIALRSRSGEQQPSCPPMERAGQVPFFVVARRDHLGLLAPKHTALEPQRFAEMFVDENFVRE
jgi:hypothetical protein